jgi:hypothetical protein
MKTKRSVYRGGGAVKNNRGMGVALKSGGRIKAKDGNWIQKAIKKPGSLRASLGVKKGNKIPAKKLNAAAKKGGKLGQRARLAQTLKGFKK